MFPQFSYFVLNVSYFVTLERRGKERLGETSLLVCGGRKVRYPAIIVFTLDLKLAVIIRVQAPLGPVWVVLVLFLIT